MSSVERGTGMVMGLSPQASRDALVKVARAIGEGNRFTRKMAREMFVKGGHSEEEAEGLVQALIRSDGVAEPVDADGNLLGRNQYSGADWRLTPGAVRYLSHRDWRLPTGRLDLASADTLLVLIRHGRDDGIPIPGALEALEDRIVKASRNL